MSRLAKFVSQVHQRTEGGRGMLVANAEEFERIARRLLKAPTSSPRPFLVPWGKGSRS